MLTERFKNSTPACDYILMSEDYFSMIKSKSVVSKEYSSFVYLTGFNVKTSKYLPKGFIAAINPNEAMRKLIDGLKETVNG